MAITMIIIELENTTTAEADLVNLHITSVSKPKGQNLVKASIAVHGIVKVNKTSNDRQLQSAQGSTGKTSRRR